MPVSVNPVVDPRSAQLYSSFEATLNAEMQKGQLKGRQHVLQIAKAVFDNYFSQYTQQQQIQSQPQQVSGKKPVAPQWSRLFNSKEYGIRKHFQTEYDNFMKANSGYNYMKAISVLKNHFMTNDIDRWNKYLSDVKEEYARDNNGYMLGDPSPAKGSSPRSDPPQAVAPSQAVATPSVMPSQAVATPSVMPSQAVATPSVMPSQAVDMPSQVVAPQVTSSGNEGEDLDLDLENANPEDA